MGLSVLIEYDMERINLMSCGTVSNSGNEKSDSFTQKSNLKTLEIIRENIPGNENARTNPVAKTLVLYTPAATATGLNLNNLVNTAVSQWQVSAVNSNLTPILEIVGIQPLNFTESNGSVAETNILTDINALSNNLTAQQLRNNFEADLVILLTDGDYSDSFVEIYGIVRDIGPNEPLAYGIVQAVSATSTYTFIHEIGHLFGAGHNDDPRPGDPHGHNWQTGFFPFFNNYKSIMSNLNPNAQRVPYFSNPTKTHEGQPTGIIDQKFNAKVINVNGSAVEAFRYSTPALWASILGPASGNNGDQISFSPSVQGGQGTITLAWYTNSGSGFIYAGSGAQLNTIMPTNNNLEIQLIVTDSNNQTFTANKFVQNNFLGGGCTTCPDNADKLNSDSLVVFGSEITPVLYPNPTSKNVIILLNTSSSSPNTFEIVEIIRGTRVTNLVQVNSITEQQIELDVSKLPNGIYLFQYVDKENFKSIRFIKE